MGGRGGYTGRDFLRVSDQVVGGGGKDKEINAVENGDFGEIRGQPVTVGGSREES